MADREMVESQIEVILKDADREDVAFLVVGDPFGYAAVTCQVNESTGYARCTAHQHMLLGHQTRISCCEAVRNLSRICCSFAAQCHSQSKHILSSEEYAYHPACMQLAASIVGCSYVSTQTRKYICPTEPQPTQTWS